MFLLNVLGSLLVLRDEMGRRIISLLSELTHDVSTFSPKGHLSQIVPLSQLLILLFEDYRTRLHRGNLFSYSFMDLYALHLPPTIMSALSSH